MPGIRLRGACTAAPDWQRCHRDSCRGSLPRTFVGGGLMIDVLSDDQVRRFQADGVLILPNLIEPDEAALVAARFDGLFRGKFETGLYPDEWNWQEGRDRPDRSRQICNGWKSDHT